MKDFVKVGWKTAPLGEVAQLRPNKKEAKSVLPDGADVSFVPMDCLRVDQVALAEHEARPLSKVYGGYTYFRDGDVLLAKITPCFENGKLGIANDLTNGVGFGSSEFLVLRPDERLLASYLYHFLNRQSFRDFAKAQMTGAVGHKRVPKELIEALEIPLPPLKEQCRIVAILDEAFEGLDRARENAEVNLQNARELFDSFLGSAFAAEREAWPNKSLTDIAENLDRRRIPITKKDRVAGNIPYYGASGVVDRVADFIFDEDLLLISEDGANLLARTYPIAFSISGKSWVNNHAHVLRFSDLDTQEYVRLYLNSISLEPYVSGMAQPKLNQAALNRIPVPFPPEEVRTRIVAQAAELWSATEELAGSYAASNTDIDELRQSLLQKAFAGELR